MEAVLAEAIAPEIDQLESLSEDELFALIGSTALSPLESSSAAIYRYAPGMLVSRFESQQIVGRFEVDLVGRGRRTVERVIDDWADELRPRVCPLWQKKPKRRDLALTIAGILMNLLSLAAFIIAAIALAIAKYLMETLCGAPSPAAAPAGA